MSDGLYSPARLLLLTVGVISHIGVSPLEAQDSTAQRSVGANAIVASSVPTAPHQTAADTGRMIWGHQDFSRYTTPLQCDKAIQDAYVIAIRTNERAGWLYSMARDTQPSVVVAVAKYCASKFQVTDVDRRDLWSFLRISLVMGDQQQVQRIIERLLAFATSTQDSAITLQGVAARYMTASPPRVALAQSLLSTLEMMGPIARLSYYEVLIGFLRYWNLTRDTATLKQQARNAITLMEAMTPTQRDLVNVFVPYEQLLSLANEGGDLGAQQTLLDSARNTVIAWRSGAGENWVRQQVRVLETRKDLYGKRLKSIAGPFWFNHQGVVHPVPGKPSLIVYSSHHAGLRAFSLYTAIRDLKTHFRDDLDITMIAVTQGFAPESGPLDPPTEAQWAAHYFLEFHRLPVALVVDSTPMTRDREGALIRGASPLGGLFGEWRALNALVVDRDGRVMWAGILNNGTDKQIVMAAIERARQPSATGE